MGDEANRFKRTACQSTDVTVVSSYEGTRDVVVVRCRRCGQTSEIDTENLQPGATDQPPTG